MNTVEKITMEAANQSRHPEFSVGDTIKVHYKIKEGGKERVQLYTGTVIARKGKGLDGVYYRASYILRRRGRTYFPTEQPQPRKDRN